MRSLGWGWDVRKLCREWRVWGVTQFRARSNTMRDAFAPGTGWCVFGTPGAEVVTYGDLAKRGSQRSMKLCVCCWSRPRQACMVYEQHVLKPAGSDSPTKQPMALCPSPSAHAHRLQRESSGAQPPSLCALGFLLLGRKDLAACSGQACATAMPASGALLRNRARLMRRLVPCGGRPPPPLLVRGSAGRADSASSPWWFASRACRAIPWLG